MAILVIEDLLANRHSLAQGLCRLGYPVESTDTRNYREMLNPADHYSTVVIDFDRLSAPRLLLLHEVRDAFPEARILILSPSDHIHDRVVSLIQGADEILIKPFDLQGLDVVLRDNPGFGD